MSEFEISHPIISNSILSFHNLPGKLPVESVLECEDESYNEIVDENKIYGELEITVSKTKISREPILLELVIDNSESMGDTSTNQTGTTMMTYVINVISNLLSYISNTPELHISISVNRFNNTFENVQQITRVLQDNVVEIMDTINKIKPSGMTNIELAILRTNDEVNKFLLENPNHKVAIVLLTDGIITSGNDYPPYIESIIKKDIPHILIGFGRGHDARLLKGCCKNHLNTYLFVDSLEDTAKAYAEGMFNLFYKAVSECVITITDGLLYDVETDKWVSTLLVNSLYSDQTRTFSVMSKRDNKENVKIDIIGTVTGHLENDTDPLLITTGSVLLDNITVLPDLIHQETSLVEPIDLIKSIFKLKSQRLLFQCVQYNGNEQSDSMLNHDKKCTSLKNELKAFYALIHKHMRENDLLDDTFMKVLCDDIYIAYTTIGTENGYMYTVSRRASSGRNSSYRVTPIGLKRQNAMNYNNQCFGITPSRSSGLSRQITNGAITQTQDYYDESDEYNDIDGEEEEEEKVAPTQYGEDDIDLVDFRPTQDCIYNTQQADALIRGVSTGSK